MKLIKISGASLNQTPLAWDSNKAHIIDAIETARRAGAHVLCLPELCVSGYGCEDAFLSAGLHEMALKIVHEIVPHTQNMAVSIGLPLFYQNGIFNTACFIVDGKIRGFVAKQYLAGDGVHYEPRWFKPWPTGHVAEIEINGAHYPIGDIIFDVSGIKIGFEICEDAWVARRPGIECSLRGADIILNPSASHFAFGKYDVRKRFVLEGSRAFGVSYIYTNLVGCEAGRMIYDGGVLIASQGALAAEGKRFTFKDVLVTSATIDITQSRMNRTRLASYNPPVNVKSCSFITVDFNIPEAEVMHSLEQAANRSWEKTEFIKNEEFARAVSLGLFDYLRKTHAQGFVVSLSGGVDSSVVSCLVYLMVHFAIDELTLERVRSSLTYIIGVDKAKDVKSMVKLLLACVYQATENSSQTTKDAAKRVAAEIGAQYYEFDVNSIVKSYVELVSKNIKHDFNWEEDDIALQNIQARVRAPGIWLLANREKKLLLNTSNRSEAAVGYATMDGDTCGGLSPIGGIDKAFLRAWLKWLETTGPIGSSSIPGLSLVNKQDPTAELRPSEKAQTDETDLMPYMVLDMIERLAIRDKKTPLEIFLLIGNQGSFQYSKEQIVIWIERFFKLWCRNQWKRERYAPSFHLDDENLDPKTWCRFPIISGNYERELQELKEYCSRKIKK